MAIARDQDTIVLFEGGGRYWWINYVHKTNFEGEKAMKEP